MTWAEVWQWRLARHYLLEPVPPERLQEVVRDVCGIHAQLMSSAELSIGLRVEDVGQREVRDALWKARSLVKTYGPRGTVHLFAADDFPVWLAALQAAPPPRPPSKQELDTLNPEQTTLVIQAMRDALDARQLTRDELAAELEQRLGAWVTEEVWPAFAGMLPRWHLALRAAATQGVLVFGPNRGNRVTYVRTDQWLGSVPQVDGQTALQTILLRYLDAYGPATEHEFARWLNIPLGAARDLWTSISDRLEEVDVEGWRAWLPASTRIAQAQPSLHLLPQFDCYVVGCHPRQQLIPAIAPPELQQGTAAPYPVVLVDGIVGGLWQRTRRGKTLQIQIGVFSPLARRHRQAASTQSARIADILGTDAPEITYAPVAPRWHM